MIPPAGIGVCPSILFYSVGIQQTPESHHIKQAACQFLIQVPIRSVLRAGDILTCLNDSEYSNERNSKIFGEIKNLSISTKKNRKNMKCMPLECELIYTVQIEKPG